MMFFVMLFFEVRAKIQIIFLPIKQNLGQVWYLIVSIPDLCALIHFTLLGRIISLTTYLIHFFCLDLLANVSRHTNRIKKATFVVWGSVFLHD